MSDLNAELDKANRLQWTMEEQRENTHQREAAIERMIEAKVSQALRLLGPHL